MKPGRIAVGSGALAAAMALAGLVAAQDAAKPTTAAPAPAAGAPATPPAPAPAVTTTPNSPAAKALANALTPEEAAPPPKAETALKPTLKAEEPPPPPKTPTEPAKRPRYTAAVMQAVDKITAETLRFETKVGEPVRFKGLVLTVKACETTAPDEITPDSVAYLDVQSQPVANPGHAGPPPRQVFKGWMFANAPAIHPFEHPVYDLWLIACRTSAPEAEAPKAAKSPSTAKAPAKRA